MTLLLASIPVVVLLGACMPGAVTDRERAEQLLQALEGTEWTQDEPYDVDFGPPRTLGVGLNGAIGQAGISYLVETKRASGGAVNIVYVVFDDYEEASSALDEYLAGMEGFVDAEYRETVGQPRYCADFAGQDECGAVSGNVAVTVLSRLKSMRLADEPHTEELMNLALAHLREVRGRSSKGAAPGR